MAVDFSWEVLFICAQGEQGFTEVESKNCNPIVPLNAKKIIEHLDFEQNAYIVFIFQQF